jgi:hypothetical protein
MDGEDKDSLRFPVLKAEAGFFPVSTILGK